MRKKILQSQDFKPLQSYATAHLPLAMESEGGSASEPNFMNTQSYFQVLCECGHVVRITGFEGECPACRRIDAEGKVLFVRKLAVEWNQEIHNPKTNNLIQMKRRSA